MTWCAVLAFFALASCSRVAPVEKVAIVVNGEPITVQEVRAQRDATPGHDSKQAMEALIDRRLLLQRALARSLDRNPGVQAALAAARERILVQAYLESLADSRYHFDPAEIHTYYEDHPALFANRRVYRLFELTAAGKADDLERLKVRAKKARTIYEVADWLNARGMPFNIGAATKAAEQIPVDILPALATLRDGEIEVLAIPGGVSVIQVIHSELQPVAEDDASNHIKRRFWSLAGAKAVPEELQWLRSKARIEYLVERPDSAATTGTAVVSR